MLNRHRETLDSERNRFEEQLLKSSRAVEQSASLMIIADATGRIEYVNPKFTQVTGYASAEVLGQNPRILKSGETPPREYQRLWEAITSGGEWARRIPQQEEGRRAVLGLGVHLAGPESAGDHHAFRRDPG